MFYAWRLVKQKHIFNTNKVQYVWIARRHVKFQNAIFILVISPLKTPYEVVYKPRAHKWDFTVYTKYI